MGQNNILLSPEEEKNVAKIQSVWKIPKYAVIKRIIREFKLK